MNKIRFKKLRLWIAYPAFIVFPIVARVTDGSFWAGVSIMVLGMLVRFWASGYITKSRVLTTSGPYAYTRNPLYLGNFLLGLGVVVVANNGWLILYYSAAFLILYAGTIQEEQKVLEEKFGEDYRTYLKKVPMFFPRLMPFRGASEKPFSLRQSFQNGEFIRIFGFSLLAVFLFLWHALLIKKQGLEGSVIFSLILFMVFSALLCFNIIIRRRSEKQWQHKVS